MKTHTNERETESKNVSNYEKETKRYGETLNKVKEMNDALYIIEKVRKKELRIRNNELEEEEGKQREKDREEK